MIGSFSDQIDSIETLHENRSNAVISSVVKNNINPLNLSLYFNNSNEIANSTQNLELNTSQLGFVIIESNFTNAGVYPVFLKINQSTNNDNATGVMVS